MYQLNRRLWGWGFASSTLIALALFVGCAGLPAVGPPKGNVCFQDDDCKNLGADYGCDRGTCKKGSAPACDKKECQRQYGPQSVCDKDGQCTQPSGCKTDKDCEENGKGSTCKEGQCTEPVECQTDKDCEDSKGEGFTCVAGSCQNNNTGCEKDEDCEKSVGKGSTCTDGECTEPDECKEDKDCNEKTGKDSTCKEGRCIAPAECKEDKDCNEKTGKGSTCTDGRCIAPNSCTKDEECQKKFDNTYKCRENTCVQDDTCKEDKECKNFGENSVCTDGKCTTATCEESELNKACEVPGKQGICKDGKTVCDNGRIVCESTIQPGTEICDNKLDDNCDGKTDESPPCGGCQPGATRTCYPTQSITGCKTDPNNPNQYQCEGPCKAGQQACRADRSWGDCIGFVGPEREACNGKDDDCNGQVDDKNPGGGGPCGVLGQQGPCATGEEMCDNGKIVCKQVTQPQSDDTCGNQIDDDCNGQIDDGCVCKNGTTQPCYTGPAAAKGKGECTEGIQFCNSGQWDKCIGAVLPTKEVCDGKDNDCDGKIDNDFAEDGKACKVSGKKGPCANGATRCQGGKIVCNATISPAKEVCDGRGDEDCDGIIDNGCTCVNGQTKSCITTNVGCKANGDAISCKGLCKAGTKTCTGGQWSKCVGETKPAKEACDQQGRGKDEDCDGLVDEDCKCTDGQVQPCGEDKGECTKGKQTCKGGKWGTCTGGVAPIPEQCDGKDNDCDGAIDNGFARLGQICSSGLGNCKANGKFICSKDGKKEECNAIPGVSKQELCNGQDDDCDGTIDNGFAKLGMSCTVGVNSCKQIGKNVCKADGSGIRCSATAITPTPEKCDGKDNDCDGQTDEGLADLTCGQGECINTVQACVGGKPQTCNPKPKKEEICDGKDNDCNGQTDEGCLCTNGTTQACYTGPAGTAGIGTCKKGSQVCSNGKWGACSGETKPIKETCDGKDNDCDGAIDESVSRSCYTGPSGTDGRGNCKAGLQICTNGTWGVCAGERTPKPEVCDAQDNDCDGSIDESITRSCYNGATSTINTGLCKAGVETCNNGNWGSCIGQIIPTAEVCDGKDNDCDGSIDENIARRSCYTGPPSTSGIGICKGGSQVCSGGSWSSCTGQTIPRAETCNGQDDDCDNQTDENLTRSCYTGPNSSAGVGLCQPGSQLCTNGSWSTCQGQVTPVAEFCTDGKDNDCDGKVDAADDSCGICTNPTLVKTQQNAHLSIINDLRMSPLGNYVATGSNQDYNAGYRFTNSQAVGGTPPYSFDQSFVARYSYRDFLSVAYDPLSRFIAYGLNDGIGRIWIQRFLSQPPGGFLLRQPDDDVYGVAIRSDGGKLVAVDKDKKFIVWNINSNATRFTQSIKKNLPGGSYGWDVQFFPGGSSNVVVGTDNKQVIVIDSSTGQALHTFNNNGKVYSVAVSPDGKTIAAGDDDKKVVLYEYTSGTKRRLRRINHRSKVYRVAFSYDGKIVAAGGEGGRVKLWRVSDGIKVGELNHGGQVSGIAFSPKEKLIVTTGTDRSIKWWKCTSNTNVNP